MITDHQALADHIASWIKDIVDGSGQTGVVLGLSGGIDSALVALLCQHGGVPVHCVNMPCHSSGSAYQRAKDFADEQGLDLAYVDLSAAHQSIVSQFEDKGLSFPPEAKAALRSCLRAPTLSSFAHAKKSLIIGTGNRSEDHITRYFQKYGDGCVDFSPIADLFKSEVRDLFEFLASLGGVKPMPDGALAIFDAKPTADLWGPDSGQEDEKELGLTYDEIEWGDREDMRTSGRLANCGIIFSNRVWPEDWTHWSEYTEREQFIIRTLHRMEKTSRHKYNPELPVCPVRYTSYVS